MEGVTPASQKDEISVIIATVLRTLRRGTYPTTFATDCSVEYSLSATPTATQIMSAVKAYPDHRILEILVCAEHGAFNSLPGMALDLMMTPRAVDNVLAANKVTFVPASHRED